MSVAIEPAGRGGGGDSDSVVDVGVVAAVIVIATIIHLVIVTVPSRTDRPTDQLEPPRSIVAHGSGIDDDCACACASGRRPGSGPPRPPAAAGRLDADRASR